MAPTTAPSGGDAETAAASTQSSSDQGFFGSLIHDVGVDEYVAKVSPLLTEYGVRAIGAIVFLLLSLWAARWASKATRRALDRAGIEATLAAFLSKVARIVILVIAAVTCLSIFGVPSTMFATAIGASGLAVGLALQGSLTNIAAGAMLAIFRPFKISDVVVLSGHTGTVAEIDLFTTRIDTFDNRRIILPNNQVFGAIIENITHNPVRRADVDVGVDYSADVDKTRSVLEQAAKSVPGRVNDPEPMVVLSGFGDSAVNWQVRVWSPTPDFLQVRQATAREIKYALDKAGIGIPFPQRVVRVIGSGPEKPAAQTAS